MKIRQTRRSVHRAVTGDLPVGQRDLQGNQVPLVGRSIGPVVA